MAFQMFWSAIAPLREAGKLGMVAFQFPPYFIPKAANPDYVEFPRERSSGDGTRLRSRRTETMSFLRSRGLYCTSIDAPEDNSIVPSFIEATGERVRLIKLSAIVFALQSLLTG